MGYTKNPPTGTASFTVNTASILMMTPRLSPLISDFSRCWVWHVVPRHKLFLLVYIFGIILNDNPNNSQQRLHLFGYYCPTFCTWGIVTSCRALRAEGASIRTNGRTEVKAGKPPSYSKILHKWLLYIFGVQSFKAVFLKYKTLSKSSPSVARFDRNRFASTDYDCYWSFKAQTHHGDGSDQWNATK